MSKMISVTVEGSLLPPTEDKNKRYANVSTRYLMIWLELLMIENFDPDLWLTRVNLDDSEVFTLNPNTFLIKNYVYTHVCDARTSRTNPETEREET